MWQVQFTDKGRKLFKKLDTATQQRITRYLARRVAPNPRKYGDPLTGDKKGLWRYRVGDYRVIAHLEDNRLLVLIVRVGHRKDIYDF